MDNILKFIRDPFVLPYKNIPWYRKPKRYLYRQVLQESAGTVVVYKNKTLLIHRGGMWNDWTFPKGVIENGSPKENALRETYEEVGLKVNIIKKLLPNKYAFYVDDEHKKINKTVYYFLAISPTNKVTFDKNPDKDESDSFIEYTWVGFSKAINLVKHQIEKDMLNKAKIEIDQ
jgi:8-oxo-dGTP pyrophosphatase MutT (NUDIX family)